MKDQSVERASNIGEAQESKNAKEHADRRIALLEKGNRALALTNVQSAHIITQMQDKIELLKNELLRYHTALSKIEPEIRRASQSLCGMKETTYCNQVAGECEKYYQVLLSLEQPLSLTLGILTQISNVKIQNKNQSSLCNLRDVLQEVLEDCASEASTRQITIKLEIDPNMPETMYLPVHAIRQIVRELLKNAFKHARPSNVAVKCCIGSDEIDDSKLVISVTDDGIGMSINTLEKIRAAIKNSPYSTLNENALGQGYTLLPHLVHQSQGRLTVESLNQGGTAVTLEVEIYHQYENNTSSNEHTQLLLDAMNKLGPSIPVAIVVTSIEDLAKDCLAIAEMATSGDACLLTNWSQLQEYMCNPANSKACLFIHGDYGLECMRRVEEVHGSRRRSQCFIYLSTASHEVKTDRLRDLGLDGMIRVPVNASKLKEVLNGVRIRVTSEAYYQQE